MKVSHTLFKVSSGTRLVQKGGKAFQSSQPASSSAAPTGMMDWGRDIVASVAKAEARTLQSARKELLEANAQRLASVLALQQDTAKNPLRERRGLKDLVPWVPVPHSCPSAIARLEAWKYSDVGNLTGQKAGLARAWKRRHQGLPKKSDKWKARPDHRCWQQGFCVCSGQGRLVNTCWNNAKKIIQRTLARELGLKEKFLKGEVCLRWRPEELQQEGEGAEPSPILWTYVALHYQKPWSPLFMMMEEVVDRVHDKGKVLRALVDDNHCPRFQAPLEMVNELNLQHTWHLQFFYLSTSRHAFPLSNGCVVVLPGDGHADPEQSFWAGTHQHARRAQPAPSQWQDVDMSDEPAVQADNQNQQGSRPPGIPPNIAYNEAGLREEEEPDDEDEHDDEDADQVDREAGGEEQNNNDVDTTDNQDEEEIELFSSELLDLWAGTVQNISEAGQSSGSSSSSSSSSTSSSGSDTGSGSDSSSSGSDSDDTPSEHANPRSPVSPGLAAEAEQEAASQPARVRRPESFELGAFLFTFKPPRSFQCTCKWHPGKPTCTKSSTYDGSDAGMEDTLKRLKVWALTAPEAADKLAHSGGMRGVPPLTGADAFRSMEDLDQAILALGFPA